MDALPIKVEAERFGSAVTEGEGGGGLGGVSEPVQLGQLDRAIGGLDVTQHTASADRGELLIITDQPDTAAATNHELDGRVQGQGVGHSGFVDDHQAGSADALRPVGKVTVVDGPSELGQRFGWCAGGVAELRCCGGGRASPTTWPSLSVHALARVRMAVVSGASRGNGQVQPRPGGAHGTNQSGLSRV
jgi:hypothetical protein